MVRGATEAAGEIDKLVGCYGQDEFVGGGGDAELRSGGEAIAVVASIDAGALGRDDFLAL